jgi:hypothetical protein
MRAPFPNCRFQAMESTATIGEAVRDRVRLRSCGWSRRARDHVVPGRKVGWAGRIHVCNTVRLKCRKTETPRKNYRRGCHQRRRHSVRCCRSQCMIIIRKVTGSTDGVSRISDTQTLYGSRELETTKTIRRAVGPGIRKNSIGKPEAAMCTTSVRVQPIDRVAPASWDPQRGTG